MKLLLHLCCAPCAVGIFEYLENENIDFEGYFYNPNIHPKEELDKRIDSVNELSIKTKKTIFINDEYNLSYWQENFNNDKKRCSKCYEIRIEEACKYAKENGFDLFTTTLLISPYQNHKLICDISNKMAKKHGLNFCYFDFRQIFRKGQNTSRQKGLYMQKYCGCIYSYYESDYKKKPVYEFNI